MPSAKRRYRSLLFAATIVAIWISQCASAELVELCEYSDRGAWEVILFWSNDDEDVARYAKDFQRVCDKYGVGKITADEANARLAEFDDTSVIVIAKNWQEANLVVRVWALTNFGVSKIVGRDAAPYWIIWFLTNIPITVICAVAYFRETLQITVIVAAVAHFVAFLMLLAGGFVAFFNTLAVILGVVATGVVILQGLRNLQRNSG